MGETLSVLFMQQRHLGGKTRLRGNGILSNFAGPLASGQLTISKIGATRGYIVMKDYANDNAARKILNKLGKNQLIIGGAWDTGIYFYWNDNKKKHRKLRLGGAIF